jgi:SM-20-related protein
MSRVKKLLPPYHIDRDVLPWDELTSLLDWTVAHQADFAPTALKNKGIDPESRLSLGMRDLGPMQQKLKERIHEMVPRWVELLRIPTFTIGKIGLELVAHNEGAHFKPHIDTFMGTNRGESSDRVLSAVYYFHLEPKSFEGGVLRLLPFGAGAESIDIQPEQNSLVVFPSWARHEVRRVSCPSGYFADSRFALSFWIHRLREPELP